MPERTTDESDRSVRATDSERLPDDIPLRARPLIVSIGSLRRAADRRRPGYLAAVLEAGRRIDENRLELDPEQWARIAIAYRLDSKPQGVGLGDAVKKALKPFVGAVDRVLGTKLSSCAGCDDRKRRLNRIRLG